MEVGASHSAATLLTITSWLSTDWWHPSLRPSCVLLDTTLRVHGWALGKVSMFFALLNQTPFVLHHHSSASVSYGRQRNSRRHVPPSATPWCLWGWLGALGVKDTAWRCWKITVYLPLHLRIVCVIDVRVACDWVTIAFFPFTSQCLIILISLRMSPLTVLPMTAL